MGITFVVKSLEVSSQRSIVMLGWDWLPEGLQIPSSSLYIWAKEKSAEMPPSIYCHGHASIKVKAVLSTHASLAVSITGLWFSTSVPSHNATQAVQQPDGLPDPQTRVHPACLTIYVVNHSLLSPGVTHPVTRGRKSIGGVQAIPFH